MSRIMAGLVTTLCLSLSQVGAAPAWAAVPSNDTVAGAVAISSLPFDSTVDVSEATSDALDATLNEQCGAPATQASIWFSYTAPAEVAGVILDVSQSSYSSGVIVAEPDGNGGYFVDVCGPDTVGFQTQEGTTYTILAFNYVVGSTGGFIRLQAEAATVPTLTVTVNPTGKVDRYGNALISGTYTCSGADWVSLDTSVTQRVGRFAIQGQGFTGSEVCDGASYAWSVLVTPYNGKFAGGKAVSVTYAFGCGTLFCADTFVSQTVRLSR